MSPPPGTAYLRIAPHTDAMGSSDRANVFAAERASAQLTHVHLRFAQGSLQDGPIPSNAALSTASRAKLRGSEKPEPMLPTRLTVVESSNLRSSTAAGRVTSADDSSRSIPLPGNARLSGAECGVVERRPISTAHRIVTQRTASRGDARGRSNAADASMHSVPMSGSVAQRAAARSIGSSKDDRCHTSVQSFASLCTADRCSAEDSRKLESIPVTV